MRLLTDNCILTQNNAQVRMINSMLLRELVKHQMNLAEAYNLIIDFHHDFEDSWPIDFVRREFPLRLCFAMTINKSQGQTFSGRVGIYLKKDVFAHGHLYIAISRATSPRNIYLCHPPMAGRGQQELENIVAPDVTDRLRRNDAAADPSTPIEN
jgi:hypothetical protein